MKFDETSCDELVFEDGEWTGLDMKKKAKMMENTPIVLNIPLSLKESLTREAKKLGLCTSTYIRMILLKASTEKTE